MNARLLKGYLLLAVTVVVLAAAAVLLVNNLDSDWTLKVYWRDHQLPRAAWLLLGGAGGLIVYWTLRRLLPAGIAAVRQGAKVRRQKRSEKRIDRLEKDRPASR